MPLHTDIRPSEFEQFIGNDTIVQSLQSVINSNTRPHTYLFAGSPGLGKTTLARIIGNKLNLNIDERNAANDNGVDFAREFVSDIMHPGFKGPTMFILDEAQRLTAQAQDILLKTLEEPPAHAYIALCTTEPEKLREAVLRRCSKYYLKKPTRRDLTRFLKSVIVDNGIEAEPETIKAIVSESKCSVGDALMYLEQIKGVEPEKQVSVVKSLSADESDIKTVCQHCLRGDWSDIAQAIDSVQGDSEKIRRAMMGYFSRVLLNGTPEAFPYLKALEFVRVENGKYGIIRALYEGTILRDKGGF